MNLLKDFLKDRNITEVEFIKRKDINLSPEEEAVEYSVPLSNLIKALVLKVNAQYCVFLVPMNKKLDFSELKSRLNCKNIRMATREEVKTCTGYEVGCVPPFGFKMNSPIYVENGFDENSMLLASAGSQEYLIKISFQELKDIIASAK